ncbi:MAG TPA: hypothetical protein VGO13_10975 [Solirubrobacterales bacterium]|jgi:hypothetical protein|nr:hypothetical protein [Solirubrobacterales bacterium]
MTSPSAEVLRERLADASDEIAGFRETLRSANGNGLDEATRSDALDYAANVVRDVDRITQIEKTSDPQRNRLRRDAEDLAEAITGRGDKAREQALAEFRDDRDQRVHPLDFLRTSLKSYDLSRVIKHGSSNSLWDLELENGTRIPLGTSVQIQEFKKVKGALLSAGRVMRRFTASEFDKVTEAFALVAETEDTVASENEETAGWLASFIADRGGQKVKLGDADTLRNLLRDPDDLALFRDEQDRIYLRLPKLSVHVTRVIGQRTTSRDLAARLSRLGFKKKQLGARDGDETLKARFWRSPPNFDVEGAA